MRGVFVALFVFVLVSCGLPGNPSALSSNLQMATLKLQQVSTLEQARAVYRELIPVPAAKDPLGAAEQRERDEFRTASVRVLKTFGRDPLVKEAYAKFSTTQADLAELLP